jgi:hypothetical protein
VMSALIVATQKRNKNRAESMPDIRRAIGIVPSQLLARLCSAGVI